MNVWFMVSLIKKRNDVADVAWGLGFVLMAWASFFLLPSFSCKQLLITILVSIWGFRLSWHIYARNKGKAEDYRYLAWRKEWGKYFYIRSYFQVYILQGICLFLVAIPVILINKQDHHALCLLDLLGVVVWLVGFCFEVVGDAQLLRFIKKPENKGKLMQDGLWAYSRHPNYFGEVTLWWGIWLMSGSLTTSLVGLISPITITFLILKVSGIPMLEKTMVEHPDFEAYRRSVSAFIPMPRK